MAPDRALTWSAYLFMWCEGYLIYAVAFITPYLQADMDLAPWLAALPNSMVAIGIVAGGFVARRVSQVASPRSMIRASAVAMAGSAILLAAPASIVVVLAGALLFGVAAGGMMVHVNSALGGRAGGTLVVRANLWSVIGGMFGPLVLSAAARSVGWPFGALVPVPLLALLAVTMPGSPAADRATAPGDREPLLPRAYWLTWTFLVLGIAAEFSFVAWGAQVVTARTGIAIADATGLASLYVLGMVAGRLVLGTGVLSGSAGIPVLRACTAVAILGSVVLWSAASPVVVAAGLFLGGLGLSGVYPLGASLALAHASHAPVRASARLTAASGAAILTAPIALGIVAGTAGVVAAWLIVLGFLGAALLLLVAIPRPETAAVDREVATVSPGA